MAGARKSGRAGYLFAAPYLLLLLAFGVGPTIYAFYISLFNTRTAAFSGLANYSSVFRDFRFLPAVEHVALYMVVWLPMMVVGVVAVALLLHARPGRFSSTMRLIYYLPSAITGSANVLLWLFILDPSLGPFKWVLQLFGWNYSSDALLPSHLAYIYAVMAFTLGCGSWIVIMFGALQNISVDVLEAATVDGCHAGQLAWHIKIPMMRKYTTYMLIMSLAGGVQLFVEPQLVYSLGGAGSPWWSVNQLAYYLGFNQSNLGAAAALSVLLLIVSLVAALAVVFGTGFFSTEVPE